MIAENNSLDRLKIGGVSIAQIAQRNSV